VFFRYRNVPLKTNRRLVDIYRHRRHRPSNDVTAPILFAPPITSIVTEKFFVLTNVKFVSHRQACVGAFTHVRSFNEISRFGIRITVSGFKPPGSATNSSATGTFYTRNLTDDVFTESFGQFTTKTTVAEFRYEEGAHPRSPYSSMIFYNEFYLQAANPHCSQRNPVKNSKPAIFRSSD